MLGLHTVFEHHDAAFANRLPLVATRTALSHPGFYKFKKDGEYHSFSPAVVHALQKAAGGGDYGLYKAYSNLVHKRPPTELRDLLGFVGVGVGTSTPNPQLPSRYLHIDGGMADNIRPALYGARYTRVSGWDEFRAAVGAGVGGRGLHIVEVPTERASNVALHREFWPRVGAALRDAGLVE